jgi:hypothetical protein
MRQRRVLWRHHVLRRGDDLLRHDMLRLGHLLQRLELRCADRDDVWVGGYL